MAELLILNRDATPEQRSYKRGDVVVVREDGHEWGRAEGLPDFVVAHLPGVSVAAVEAALTMPRQIEAAELAPSAVRASMARLAAYVRATEPERVTRRRYRVPSALLDAHVAGRITVALNNIEDKKRAP